MNQHHLRDSSPLDRTGTLLNALNRLSTGSCVLLAVVVAAGCADNAIAPPQAIATTLEAITVTNTTGVAGSAVTERPSVIVRDQNAAPMAGVRVSFAAVSGTASLGEPSVLSDAAGRATVGEWVLSRAVGLNVISATTGTLRVDFSAIGIAGPPATMEKLSGDNQFAFPGSAVPVLPTVVVRDAYGNGVAGAEVSFAVVSGGGSLSDATSSSNDEGIARPGSWTLGPIGAQSVTAVVTGVTPTVFTATSSTDRCDFPQELLAGSSATLELLPADCKSSDGALGHSFMFRALIGGSYVFSQTTTSFDPNLLLTTVNGTPVANAGSTALSGSASFKVFLVPGPYTLRAGSAGSTGSGFYTIAAGTALESVANCEEVFITRGSMTQQTLASTDCPESGRVSDRYRIYLDAGTKITITVQASLHSPLIWVYDSRGIFVEEGEADTYGGRNARLVFEAETTGFHLISVMNDGPPAGAYTLWLD